MSFRGQPDAPSNGAGNIDSNNDEYDTTNSHRTDESGNQPDEEEGISGDLFDTNRSPSPLTFGRPNSRRIEDDPLMPVVNNHRLKISVRQKDTIDILDSDSEARGTADIEQEGPFAPVPDPVSSRFDEVSDCVDSIKEWVADCHQHKDVNDSIFPKNITIRGTQLLDVLDRLAALFYDEFIDNSTGYDGAETMVRSVASIPGFTKSVLLIDRESERMQVLQKRFMKRVLLHDAAVYHQRDDATSIPGIPSSRRSPDSSRGVLLDSWLLAFLDSGDSTVKSRAVDYLEYVSNLKMQDYLLATIPKTGEGRPGGDSSQELEAKFFKSRKTLFERIASFRHLEMLLMNLPDEQLERAAVCGAVRWSMQKSMRRPFVLFMNFCDILFHITLLFVWRLWLLQDTKRYQGYIDTANSEVYLSGFSATLAAMAYFCYRWIGDLVAILRIKTRLVHRFILSLPTVLQALMIVLVCLIMADADIPFLDGWYSAVAAISLGCLWLKIVLFLQVINEKMAAYLLAIGRILMVDIGFFCVIVFATTIAFGDVLYTLIATDVYYCTPYTLLTGGVDSSGSNQTYTVLGDFLVDLPGNPIVTYVGRRTLDANQFFVVPPELQTEFNYSPNYFPQPDNATIVDTALYVSTSKTSKNPFCQSRLDSYFAIYRIYLGNFDFGDFRKSALTTALFVLVTFIALIVLVNLLIAIIQMSYSISMQKADRLFGRARLLMISQVLALEDLLHPNIRGEKQRRHQGGSFVIHIFLRLLTIAVILFIALAIYSLASSVEFWAPALNFVPQVVLFRAMMFFGLLPLGVILIQLFTGWDESTKSSRCISRAIRRSSILTWAIRLPVRALSMLSLGIPLRESKDDENLLHQTADRGAGEDTDKTQVDMTLSKLEHRIDMMGTSLRDRFHSRLERMECRIVEALDRQGRQDHEEKAKEE